LAASWKGAAARKHARASPTPTCGSQKPGFVLRAGTPYDPLMLFVLSLLVRALTRLLVGSPAEDGAKDLEILVLRHQLRVLRRKTRPRFTP
jgi:hypothetical protein